jgi:tetratricopeptide (TPR) repeat protein
LTEAETEFYLGDLLLHLNRPTDAEPHLTTALSKNSSLAGAQASLALLRVRQKKYDEALSLLKKAVETNPNNPMINYYYAYVIERADSDALTVVNDLPADRYEMMRSHAKKSIELSPRFVEAYALLARINVNTTQNLDEGESTLKKALAIAPGRDDLRMVLAQTYVRANRTADARTVLSDIERISNDPELRRRATALLDQTEQLFSFTEIKPAAEKEPKEATADQSPSTSALPPPPAPKNAVDTVLEALTPIGPNVEGEKLSGLLVNMDCSNGLTLRVRADRGTLDFHSSQPDKIQFLSYTSNVMDNVKCGPHNPGIPVSITYRSQTGGSLEPLVVEFQENK